MLSRYRRRYPNGLPGPGIGGTKHESVWNLRGRTRAPGAEEEEATAQHVYRALRI